MEDRVVFKPQKGPQEKFLATPADICIYGGSAGGGKSFALLLEAIRHIDNSNFGAVIFRKNNNQIMAEGGLWDTSLSIYLNVNGVPKKTPVPHWDFPSGAKISFHHMSLEKDVYAWQGSQIPLIAFDELTHFSKSMFFYMLSRNRSTCGVRPYVRATCNPDADSWVAEFISWWIDQDTGYAMPERSGVIRWMYRSNNEIHWADTKEELWERFDLKTDTEKASPKSVTFISAKLTDNKALMDADPGYLANLKALPTVERERLLEGNWKIKPAAGLVFPRGKANIVEQIPGEVRQWVRAWDFAATASDEDDPDKTASVLIGKTRDGRYIVADVKNKALSASDVRMMVKTVAQTDKLAYKNVKTRISQDPGQAGKDQAEQYIKLLAGFSVVSERETGDKVMRSEGFASQWQAGNVDVLLSDWTDMYLDQMDNFPQAKHDDMVDASANAFNEIEKTNVVVPFAGFGSANRNNGWRI